MNPPTSPPPVPHLTIAPQRALVIGASGFAGKHLVPLLLSHGDSVVATYHRTPLTFGDTVEARSLDITDAEQCQNLIHEVQPEAIYYLSAISFVPDAERDFRRVIDVNVLAAHSVLRAAAELDKNIRIVVVSSAEAYGSAAIRHLPLHEDQQLEPVNNYGLSKAMLELVARRYFADRRLRPVVARSFNHIGTHQRTDFVVSNFACQIAKIAKGKAAPVMRVGNLSARRDFCDVRDLVRGYRLAAAGSGCGPYNFCSGRSVLLRDLLDLLIAQSGVKVSVEIDPSRLRPVDIPEMRGNYDRSRSELGWEPKIPIEDSIREIFQHWFEQV